MISKRRNTTEPAQPGNFTGVTPEFGRDAQVHLHFGIKRGTLRNLYRQGKIRGVLLRICGSKSGVRLWHLQSIRDYIEAEMQKGGAL